ncbi:Brix domain-containing protein [Fimicolochytrium jonesii]|uniref:Brix domain-containing protein n=1 Tax=Fimicolochytrium jonesii TaxID=1396493 RepID=UPI0022FE8E7B|nr:Brix domain-containing protein [Fimicolochytrium jonesii]KAI8823963.1 Brix domain-containing protein [Fimicolochytrium jonesii]
MLRTAKPKTAAGKRALKKREPQVIEGAKPALFMKGTNTSQLVTAIFRDLYSLKRPDATLFSKRNELRPFEDPRPLEFFSTKTDASLLVLATHSKKRPHNLTFARTFDHQLLDMIEVGVERGLPMEFVDGPKSALGHRPLILFAGDAWDGSDELRTLKSILLDMYRGTATLEGIDLAGIEHVLSLTAVDSKTVKLRTYTIQLKKSGTKLPRVELTEMGPAADLVVRRHRGADGETWKAATKIPKELMQSKTKNIERNALGDKVGRIHMHKQDLDKLQTRKMKGLKRGADEKDNEGEEEEGEAPAFVKKVRVE